MLIRYFYIIHFIKQSNNQIYKLYKLQTDNKTERFRLIFRDDFVEDFLIILMNKLLIYNMYHNKLGHIYPLKGMTPFKFFK